MTAGSHYEVLGVSPLASPEVIRRAYRQLARQLHPDRQAAAPPSSPAEVEAGRAMQELNEAWRVLSDPVRRAHYDQLLAISAATGRTPDSRRGVFPDEDDDDRPFSQPLARPGDVGISIVRSLPWVVAVAVLGAIFVFTAFAGDGADDSVSGSDLVGSCVVLRRGGDVEAVPCDGPSDGRVDLVAARSSLCPEGSDVARLAGEQSWLCLRDPTSQEAPTEGLSVPR